MPAGGYLPQGALPPVSEDGTQVLFKANLFPGLYLRSDGTKSVEVSKPMPGASDPNPPAEAISAGISADGQTVLFTSANRADRRRQHRRKRRRAQRRGQRPLLLRRRHRASSPTSRVDTDPADVATGADVQEVLGASPDAAYVYFVARGKLAPGGTSGERNLYVAHDGVTDFIATDPEPGAHFYVTPDGLHAAFTSTSPQGGYDNAGFAQAYRYTFGAGIECGSCRPGGEPPAAGASLAGRSLSDDGGRLFFQSADAILPAAQSAAANVYEYTGGAGHLLTPGEGAPAILLGASASGDDVFIASFEELSPQGQGKVFSIYDARVGAVVPVAGESPGCQGETCRGPSTPRRRRNSRAGSAGFEAPSKVAAPEERSVGARQGSPADDRPGPREPRGRRPRLRPLQAPEHRGRLGRLHPRPAPGRRCASASASSIFRTEAEVSFRSAVRGDLAGERRADLPRLAAAGVLKR